MLHHRLNQKVLYEYALEETKQVSLCEVLDRILNKGAVVKGEVTISVANIDLIYLSLQVVLTSIETARREMLRFDTDGSRQPRKQAGQWQM